MNSEERYRRVNESGMSIGHPSESVRFEPAEEGNTGRRQDSRTRVSVTITFSLVVSDGSPSPAPQEWTQLKHARKIFVREDSQH
jgi:hypothetical protein